MNAGDKRLLQYLYVKNCADEDEVTRHYKKCLDDEDIDENAFKEALGRINVQLAPCQMAVKRMRYEVDSKVYMTVVHTSDRDDLSKISSEFTADQLRYFEALLNVMLASDGMITRMAAVDLKVKTAKNTLGADLNSASKTHMLNMLEAQKWILYEEDEAKNISRYYIGPRTMMELQIFIEDKVDSVCSICEEAVVTGTVCGNEKCSGKYHAACANSWFANRDDDAAKLCPTCRLPWKN